MFSSLEDSLIINALVSIVVITLFLKCARCRFSKLNLPPSPWKLPVIGNLHQLGHLPHRSLQSLAKKYGPLMLLHFGQVPTLVVSSSDATKEIFKIHDVNFSSRPKMKVPDVLFQSSTDVAFTPYNEYWKQARKIAVLELLSPQRIASFRSVRKEEGDLMIKSIGESCTCISKPSVIDLSEILTSMSMDVISRVALGRKYGNVDGRNFFKMIRETMHLVGTFNIGDFIPWLSWINHFNGFNAMLDRNFKEVDSFFENVIEEHNQQGSEGVEDFVDVLFRFKKDGSINGLPFTRANIKALLLDIFLGGTDSTSSTIIWAMTELIRNPEILKKVQKEIRDIGKGKACITEDDVEQMHYLKMVIKETLRLYPAAPLLLPRESTEHVKVCGYDIAAKTRVIINAWSMGRDPLLWDNPESFQPERFANCFGNYRGDNFGYVPFGGGRRICVGMGYSKPNTEFPLANILFHFDWSLPEGMSPETLDVSEGFGIIAFKKSPLLLIPTLPSL